MHYAQARLIHNIEYQLGDQWVKVPQGSLVHYCDEMQCAYFANESELFHCAPENVELLSGPRISLVPPLPNQQFPLRN